MSPTTLTVELAGDGNQTAMTVRTASKGYVYGDVFGFYDRFIEDVFNRTHRQLVAQP